MNNNVHKSTTAVETAINALLPLVKLEFVGRCPTCGGAMAVTIGLQDSWPSSS